MDCDKKPSGYWTKERCQEEALKYNSKSELKKKRSRVYNISLKNKWLDEICFHMIELKKPNNYWTKERCQEEALKNNTRNEFKNMSRSAYSISLKNKWLDDVCSHMKKRRNRKNG